MKRRKLIRKLNNYCSSVDLNCNSCLIKDEECIQKLGCSFDLIEKQDLKELLVLIQEEEKEVLKESAISAEEINKFLLLKSLTTSELKAEIKNRTRLAILTGNEEGVEGEAKIK